MSNEDEHLTDVFEKRLAGEEMELEEESYHLPSFDFDNSEDDALEKHSPIELLRDIRNDKDEIEEMRKDSEYISGQAIGIADSIRQSISGETPEEVYAMEKIKQKAKTHTPEYESAKDKGSRWDSLDLEDFPEDYFDDNGNANLEQIDDHFILSDSGFPPEKYSDLSYPVVDVDGTLRENALEDALDAAEMEGDNDVKNIVISLANNEFPEADWIPEDERDEKAQRKKRIERMNKHLRKLGKNRRYVLSKSDAPDDKVVYEKGDTMFYEVEESNANRISEELGWNKFV